MLRADDPCSQLPGLSLLRQRPQPRRSLCRRLDQRNARTLRVPALTRNGLRRFDRALRVRRSGSRLYSVSGFLRFRDIPSSAALCACCTGGLAPPAGSSFFASLSLHCATSLGGTTRTPFHEAPPSAARARLHPLIVRPDVPATHAGDDLAPPCGDKHGHYRKCRVLVGSSVARTHDDKRRWYKAWLWLWRDDYKGDAFRALAPLVFAVAVACGSSSTAGQSSPNKIVGQCVLSSGVWYCGGAYGNFPDCPVTSGPCTAAPDAGCFSCLYDGVAGASCGCLAADGGSKTWQCNPTGTGCHK
jgi:hypothetical protein